MALPLCGGEAVRHEGMACPWKNFILNRVLIECTKTDSILKTFCTKEGVRTIPLQSGRNGCSGLVQCQTGSGIGYMLS